MTIDNRCIICSKLLTRQNSHYKSELCFNCEANVDGDCKNNIPKKKNKKIKEQLT